MTPTPRISQGFFVATLLTIATPAALDAALCNPADVVVPDGSRYCIVADTGNHVVKRIASNGEVVLLAGTPGVTGTDNGSGSAALLNTPSGVAVDIAGNVYVADTGNHVIRLIDSSGRVSTFAGRMGIGGFADGDKGTVACFQAPEGIVVDSSGNVYVADTGNSLIREIAAGKVTTLAGGTAGETGFKDGKNRAAWFANPTAITLAESGDLYVADTGNAVIRRVDINGHVTTLAIDYAAPPVQPPDEGGGDENKGGGGGGGAPSIYFLILVGVSGIVRFCKSRARGLLLLTAVWFVCPLLAPNGKMAPLVEITTASAESAPVITSITYVAIWPGNPVSIVGENLQDVQTVSFGAHEARITFQSAIKIVFIVPDGVTGSSNVVVKSPAGTCMSVQVYSVASKPSALEQPVAEQPVVAGKTVDITAGAQGNPTPVYKWQVKQFGGTTWMDISGAGDYSGQQTGHLRILRTDDKNGWQYRYVAMNNTEDVYSSAVTLKVMPAALSAPSGIVVTAGSGRTDLYVSDQQSHTVHKIQQTEMKSSLLAGLAFASGNIDRSGTAARFNQPRGMTINVDGQLLLADSGNSALRTITASGVTDHVEVGAAVVQARINTFIKGSLDNPYPDPGTNPSNPGNEFQAKAAYALAAFYAGSSAEIATANSYIEIMHDADHLGVIDAENITQSEFLFPMVYLTRIATGANLDGKPMISQLSATARAKLYSMLWLTIRTRSKVDTLAGSNPENIWKVLGSENIDNMWKSAFLLASQALLDAGAPYGPAAILADGRTLQEHNTAWNVYWKEYFRQRGREGILLEVASPTYEKYSVAVFYNIMDCAADAVTRLQAKKLLTLYWADAANDFCVGASLRGGPGFRMYQDGTNTNGILNGMRQWHYMYGWHDMAPTNPVHPILLCAAMSAYRLPEIVTACATQTNKVPYASIRRTPGRGTKEIYVPGARASSVELPSHILRQVHWTPDYVMGIMTFDPSKTYCESQNRFSGVFFSNGLDERLLIQGKGTQGGGLYDMDGVAGVSSPGAMVIALGKDVAGNDGVTIYACNNLYNSRVDNIPNWIFMRTGKSYVGIFIPTGGGTWIGAYNDGANCTRGKFFHLGDKWTPFVVQCGRMADYASFEAFQSSVVSNAVTFDGITLSYTTEAGDTLSMTKQNIAAPELPRVNGLPVNVNPAKTYDSPYISATYGSSLVTIRHPDYADVTLDFDY